MFEPILVGALLGAVFAVAARRRDGEGKLRIFGVGLVVAALIYVGLVLPSGDTSWLALEAAGVAAFGAVAWLASRRPAAMALGWLAHVGWDVALHLDRAQVVVNPWYPLGCIGFDLIVAGFLLAGSVSLVRSRALALAVFLLGVSPEVLSAQASGQDTAPRVTNLAGARDRPGLFTQRLLLPANYCGQFHTHDRDLHGLVLRGTLLMGFADSSGNITVQQYPPGSFVPVPAGRVHLEGSAVETEIHLSGIGPVVTTVVDSTQQRCRPTSQ